MASRKDLRDAVKVAIAADGTLGAYRLVPWGDDLSASDLVGLSVATPREPKARQAARKYRRDTDLLILVKRRGGDGLEDDLDTDAAAAEAVGLAALAPVAADVEAVLIETEITGRGEQRLGAIAITFRVIQLTSEPG